MVWPASGLALGTNMKGLNMSTESNSVTVTTAPQSMEMKTPGGKEVLRDGKCFWIKIRFGDSASKLVNIAIYDGIDPQEALRKVLWALRCGGLQDMLRWTTDHGEIRIHHSEHTELLGFWGCADRTVLPATTVEVMTSVCTPAEVVDLAKEAANRHSARKGLLSPI